MKFHIYGQPTFVNLPKTTTTQDLRSLAYFNKIIRNSLLMDKMLKEKKKTMNEQVELIKAEIERLKEKHIPNIKQPYLEIIENLFRAKAYDEALAVIDSLPETEPSKDLEREIERYFHKIPLRAGTPGVPDEYIDDSTFTEIARHFANWQKERMLKDAVEGRTHLIGFHNTIYIKEPQWTDRLDKFEDGDKVRIFVIKEDGNEK